MKDGESEIDDHRFFFAKDGKTNAKAELNETIYALFNEKTYDDNSTACRFPARKAWLEEELQIWINLQKRLLWVMVNQLTH